MNLGRMRGWDSVWNGPPRQDITGRKAGEGIMMGGEGQLTGMERFEERRTI